MVVRFFFSLIFYLFIYYFKIIYYSYIGGNVEQSYNDPRNNTRGMANQLPKGNYDQNQVQQQHSGGYQGEFQPRQNQQFYPQLQMQSQQHNNYQQPNNNYF